MKFRKRKKGFSFIHTLIIFMFVVLIVNVSINLINYNILKSDTFYSYSDRKTLTLDEELILMEINKNYNNKSFEYNDNNYELITKGKNYYLVKKTLKSNYYYMLEEKEYNKGKILIPTYYKTENIMGDIKYD